jgi:hypothetical protein
MISILALLLACVVSGYRPGVPCESRHDGGELPCDDPCSSCYSGVPDVTKGEVIYGDQLLTPGDSNFERWPTGEGFHIIEGKGIDASVVFSALNSQDKVAEEATVMPELEMEFSATSEHASASSASSVHLPLSKAGCLVISLVVVGLVGAAALVHSRKRLARQLSTNTTPMISSL